MCGRYSLSTPPEVLAAIFRLPSAPDLRPHWNIAPTQKVPIVRRHGEGRRLTLVRWGLVPHWATEMPVSTSDMINARAETVAVRPAFRQAFRKRRCLVPADGFYEWRRENKRKQPFLIRMRDESPFAFAGLWEKWHNPAIPGHGGIVESCTILTTEPNVLMRDIHNRMPVILAPADYDSWLDPDVTEPDELAPMLIPSTSDLLVAYPVSTHVNSAANDDARCVEPVGEMLR